MSKLIYSCVFFKEEYLKFADLLLESYARNPIADTKYLIITGIHYKLQIQEMFNKHGIDGDIWCLNIFTQFDATCARLYIFSYPDIKLYEQILYLDVDTLITNSLKPIFDINTKEKLYCHGQEIAIKDWGSSKKLFAENKIDVDLNRNGFSTGIMLFRNCNKLHTLFTDILDHIKERVPGTYDLEGTFEEDFIIYQCFVQDCYNDKELCTFVQNNCVVQNTSMIINHFCAINQKFSATAHGKLDKMHQYLSTIGIEKYRKNIIHIGANVGNCYPKEEQIFQVFDMVSPNDFCFFVEPVPYLFKQLVENYNTAYPDNNFVYINKAVSNTIGEAEMTIVSEKNDFDNLPFYATMLSSINEKYIAEHELNLITEKIMVPTTTLNEIVKIAKLEKIDLLVIDAEGHDFEILNAYDFSIIPKRIIFEQMHLEEGKLTILLSKLTMIGYKQVGFSKSDIILDYSR